MSASDSERADTPRGIVAWFASNPVAANLLMVLILAAGLVSLPGIRQEVFPEFSANVVTASVVYPGAAPEEVEESICVRIEEEVYAIEGVKRILSTAAEGAGAVSIEVASGYDVRRVLDDVKAAVDGIDTFPEEAERPVVSEVTLRKQVLYVAIAGDAPERVLHRLGEEVRDDLAALEDVGQAELYGVRPYEVSIEVGEADLQRNGLSFQQVADAVRRSALDVPGGGIKTQSGEVLLRARGRAYRGEEFERLAVLTRADGTRVELGQVARVVDGYADSSRIVRFDGKPAVLVAVFRTGEQSALGVGSAVKRYVAEAGQRLPEGVELTIWRDDSRFLRERLDTLLSNARSGLILVFLVLALFLRLRLAFWVTLGIPISFLGTLAVMPLLGASINMLSLFAFILVLGIVVDDAIVVGESVYNKQSEGLTGLRGSIQGAREVAVPVTFAVLTTVVAFLPMLGLEGLTGRIWRIIPAVVIPALLFSLIESKLILPAHLAHGGAEPSGPRRAWLGLWDRVQRRFADGLVWVARSVYRPSLELLLRWRWTTAAGALAIFLLTVGLVVGGHVKLTFFPPVEGDNVVALLTMPRGTPVDVTARAVARIEAAALELSAELDGASPQGEPEVVRHMLTSVGEQPYLTEQSRNGGRTGERFEGEHLGEVNLQLSSSEVRDVTAAEIARRWRERVGGVPDAVELVFTSSLFSAGKPIDLQLSGRDIDTLTAAARALQARLADYPGVYDIADSFRAGKAELTLRIRPGAESLGLTLSDLGRQVRAAFWGEEAQRIQRGRDEVKVMVRFPADERRSLADLEAMRIRTPGGAEVPFREVAEVVPGRGFASIARTDRERTVHVTAEVDSAVANANEILDDVTANVLPDLLAEHRGVSWAFAGERKEQSETLSSLARGFALAILGIYALMAIPFKSYLQPLVVMTAVPFGLVGAVLGHVLVGIEVSILSMIGAVALAGVVVNDSLVMVDFINREREAGHSLAGAVRAAGVQRFRPILLTSLTTFAGLLPMLLERSVQAAFLIPMAVSLAFGVLFSTAISLVIVPCGTVMLEDVRALLTRRARAADVGASQGA